METLELHLIRTDFTETATMGRLMLGDEKLADTLEDVMRKLPETCPYTSKGQSCQCKEKVYGKTCIPFGKYKVIYRYSPKFKNYYPALEGVPHFIGILIHAGANVDHTEGCILTGEKVNGKEQLVNQFAVTNKIKKIVKSAINEGKEVYITIE